VNIDSGGLRVDASDVRHALTVALAAVTLVAMPGVARAKRPTTAELAADGLTDPRRRPPPPRHRLRLAIVSDYVRASAAQGRDGKVTRFHYATLMLDLAYQVQLFKVMMIRPSFAFGGNVANSRNAMPFAIQPALFAGYQGALLGVAAGYSFILPFPATIGVNNNHNGATQPVLYDNHLLQGEVSLTTRVDRGALNFGLRVGAMKSHLIHLNIDKRRWAPVLTLSAGWFWDLSTRRRRPPRPRPEETPAGPPR
jgi:hypothetical protein